MVRLADIRKEAGLTQVELAQKARLSEQTVIKLELGLHVPGLDTLRALCEALGPTVFEAQYGWKREIKQRGRPRKVTTIEEARDGE